MWCRSHVRSHKLPDLGIERLEEHSPNPVALCCLLYSVHASGVLQTRLEFSSFVYQVFYNTWIFYVVSNARDTHDIIGTEGKVCL